MNPATVFMLIAVTGGGSVSNSTYPSQHLCEEAKSIALVGKSLEQIAAADQVRSDADAQWFREHPPRSANNAAERRDIERTLNGEVRNLSVSGSDGTCYSVTQDGKIQDCPPSDRMTISGPYSPNEGELLDNEGRLTHRSDVKTAQCFPVAADSKP